MPSAILTRKEILQSLENQIIPMLRQRDISLGCVTPQLHFPENISARLLSPDVPRKDTKDLEFPRQACWPKAHLHAEVYPYWGFLYEGTADECTLITAAQAAGLHISKGIYAIRWQAPSLLLFPPGVPRSMGTAPFWYGSGPAPDRKILWLHDTGFEVLVRNGIKDITGRQHRRHPLQIADPTFVTLARLFIKELQQADVQDQQPAQAILLAMMLCLQKSLRSKRAAVANSSHSHISALEVPADNHAGKLCRDAAVYIEMHLHEALTLPGIAARTGLSPAHLNRLFRQYCGVTVMRYVRSQRIAAAKGLLEKTSENNAEIAQLIGLKRATAFCDIFRRETGFTPSQFRRHIRLK